MLIRIEEGTRANQWIVKLDDYPVICSTWQQASEFAERMQRRIDAPHSLPALSVNRLEALPGAGVQ